MYRRPIRLLELMAMAIVLLALATTARATTDCGGSYTYYRTITNTDANANPFLVNDTYGVTLGGSKQIVWCGSTANYFCYNGAAAYACFYDNTKVGTFVDEGGAASYSTPETNLTSWYHMNSTADSSIYGNTLTGGGTGGPVAAVGEKMGGVYVMDGNDYFTRTPTLTSGVNIFTLEAWVNTTNLAAVNNIYAENDFDGSFGSGLQFGIQADGDLQFQYSSTGGWLTLDTNGRAPIKVNNWYYIVYAANGTDVNFYVNGQFNGSGVIGSWNVDTAPIKSVIGAVWYDTASITNYLVGKIDEVRIYNRTLSAAEILARYNNGKPNAYSVLGSEQTLVTDTAPTSALVSPATGTTDTDLSVTFNCSCTDDKNCANITLWTNSTGTWHANQTVAKTGVFNFSAWTIAYPNKKTILWNCKVMDNSSQSDWGDANFTVNTDTGKPYMISFYDYNITTSAAAIGILGTTYGDLDNNAGNGREFLWSYFHDSGGIKQLWYVANNGSSYKILDNGTESGFMYWGFFLPIDYNNDGKLELIFPESTQAAHASTTWFMDINGTTLSNFYESDNSVNSDDDFTKPAGYDDYNGDGVLDFVQGYCGSGEVNIINGSSRAGKAIRDYSLSAEHVIGYNVNGTSAKEMFVVEGSRQGSIGTNYVHMLNINSSLDASSDFIALTLTGTSITTICDGIRDVDGDGIDDMVIHDFNDNTDTATLKAYNMTASAGLTYEFTIGTYNTHKTAWSCIVNDFDKDGVQDVSLIYRNTDDKTKTFNIYSCPGGTCTSQTIYSGVSHTINTTVSRSSPDYLYMNPFEPEGVFPMAGFTDDPIVWAINYTLPLISKTKADTNDVINVTYTAYDSGSNSTTLKAYWWWYSNATGLNLSGAVNVPNGTQQTLSIPAINTASGQTYWARIQIDDGYENSTAHNSTSVIITGVGVDATPPTVTITSPTATVYNNNTIWLNITTSEAGSQWYSLNGGANITFSNICYQENAQTATSCGGLSTGSYSSTGSWGNVSAIYDNNWNTQSTAPGPGSFFVNYTIPTGATAGSWWYKINDYYSGNTTSAYAVPASCFGQIFPNIVSIQILKASGSPALDCVYCYASAGWVQIHTPDYCWYADNIYEEAINWTIPITPINVTINASVGSNTVYVYANDSSGNLGSASVTFSYAPPSLPQPIFVSPTVANNSVQDVPYAYFNVSNPTAVTSCLLNWNNGTAANYSMTVSGNYCFINMSQLTNISNVLTFAYVANATGTNITATINISFAIPYPVPVINITSPVGGATYTNLSLPIWLNYSIISNYTALSAVWFNINGSSNTTLTGNRTISQTIGYNILTVYANDTLGNIGYTTVSFIYFENTTATVRVTLNVMDIYARGLSNITIQVEKYYPDLGIYALVGSTVTDVNGVATFYFQMYDTWYRFIFLRDGAVVDSIGPMLITSDPLNLVIEETTSGEWFDYFGKTAYSCVISNATNTTTCSVVDSSEIMQSSRLQVMRWTGSDWATVCDTNSTSATATHVCSMGTLSGNMFWYSLTADYPSATYGLESSTLDYRTAISRGLGMLGVLISLMLIITMAFVGAYKPAIAMILTAVTTMFCFAFGVMEIAYGSIIAFGVVVAVAVVIVGKK